MVVLLQWDREGIPALNIKGKGNLSGSQVVGSSHVGLVLSSVIVWHLLF